MDRVWPSLGDCESDRLLVLLQLWGSRPAVLRLPSARSYWYGDAGLPLAYAIARHQPHLR